MLIGVPKEIKDHEYRVGVTPAGVRELVKNGHQVIVQDKAGIGIDFTNEQYIEAGATIVSTPENIYKNSQMIIKVKELQEIECKMLRGDQILFSYLHLAAEPELTKYLINSNTISIAFETVSAIDNSLPLLAPMSEVAGRMSIQAGAKCLEKSSGGRGVLLGGVPGVMPANVVIIGGGIAGINAAKMAIGLNANVTIIEKSLPRMRYLSDVFGNSLKTLYASTDNIENAVIEADLVIGAVLIPGFSAPKVVSRSLLRKMKKGAVMVDISIDQGGCFETSKPTSHSNPTYVDENVVHYCVTNIPGAVPRTSTLALENSTLPFSIDIANKGYKKSLLDNPHLRNGLNIINKKVVHKGVAESLGYEFVDPLNFLV